MNIQAGVLYQVKLFYISPLYSIHSISEERLMSESGKLRVFSHLVDALEGEKILIFRLGLAQKFNSQINFEILFFPRFH